MTTQNNTDLPTWTTPETAHDALYEMPEGAVVAVDYDMWVKGQGDTWSGPSERAWSDEIAQDVSPETPLLRIDGLPEVQAAIAADAEMKQLAEDAANEEAAACAEAAADAAADAERF